MAVSTYLLLPLALVLVMAHDAEGKREFCSVNGTLVTCEWGCCDKGVDRECCQWLWTNVHTVVWLSLLGVALLVTVVILLIFFCKKKTVVPGRVVQNQGAGNSFVVSQGPTYGYPNAAFGMTYVSGHDGQQVTTYPTLAPPPYSRVVHPSHSTLQASHSTLQASALPESHLWSSEKRGL